MREPLPKNERKWALILVVMLTVSLTGQYFVHQAELEWAKERVFDEGAEQGYNDGYGDGYGDGYDEGYNDAEVNILFGIDQTEYLEGLSTWKYQSFMFRDIVWFEIYYPDSISTETGCWWYDNDTHSEVTCYFTTPPNGKYLTLMNDDVIGVSNPFHKHYHLAQFTNGTVLQVDYSYYKFQTTIENGVK